MKNPVSKSQKKRIAIQQTDREELTEGKKTMGKMIKKSEKKDKVEDAKMIAKAIKNKKGKK